MSLPDSENSVITEIGYFLKFLLHIDDVFLFTSLDIAYRVISDLPYSLFSLN